ncbi:hypothetical protein [Streptomyces griseomycini]|uniref:Secreted protein n=1 Tax=Streptomyces griseomycini TaxID=66895 RepID=A0A7W7PRI4_9ACTN|nr:hypothetical protein [Streptomyces griseomycini]MBB4898758.1 hypothetical protein [Streptomyces griseomycini]GGQ03716.1 hypothetical protein GCM10010266_29040 [Streptomyces griseomycini]GGR18814.1 hypothetical protein GCM10015536_25550 [Streptomyces griseomycini]
MRTGIAAGLAVLTAVGGAVAVAGDDGRRVFPRASYDPFRGSAAAQEWVAHGDHAAVVRVTREEAGEPDPEGDHIPRTVTATVTRTVWSRPGAPRLPEEITLRAKGWYTTLRGGREEAAREGAPRLEPGHTYVVGLTRLGSGVQLIGDDAALPYDAGTLGRGELEGRTVTPGAYRRAVLGLPEDAVAKFAVGETYRPRTLRDVQRLLEGTSPRNVYRQEALSGLYTDVNLDRAPDDHADEGAEDLPGRVRRRVPALDPGTDHFLSVACSGRGDEVTVRLTVAGATTTHRLPCNTGNELVAVKRPRGEVTYEIASTGPDAGAVAWNLSEAPGPAGRER